MSAVQTEVVNVAEGLGGKTLLLVGSVPGQRNVGQILLREMLDCLGPSQFVVAGLLSAGEVGDTPQSDGVRIFRRPHEHSSRAFPGRLGGMVAAINRLRDYEPVVATLADEVHAYAQDNGVNRVWAILNMPSVIDVCTRLMTRLDVPLLAHVWDDVNHLSRQQGLDAMTRWRTERRFGSLLARAERTAVIGETMSAHYSACYGARCQIVRHGVADGIVARDRPTGSDEFVIGFSGGMYCPSAWNAFQAALDRLGWQTAGKRIRLVVMSGQVTFKTSSPARVDYLGWRSDAEVHERLATCDLLYLPQPFEASQRELAELSFPTKLSAYVSTGRPVLVHAPQHASLPVFARAYPLGQVCTSLDPAVIAAVIQQLATEPGLYAESARASTAIANSVLSKTNFSAQVRAFVDGGAA
ncbi:hypothetical protein [Thermomonas carbonis]|uniref:Glycosyltransferase n=1 Tax=Thermomonas carbonis TaxID=1463158 RepID=A0A7G9SN34_9GAMM|nr:hypothetical protein [Thermomonas carbonis]QNN69259.1 hypothetical protein H9L16_11310 [Thermomonas carbonis]GHC05655.1 hypothetical protein GCM10010080_19400 [Thermomonas carbonis]